MSQRGIACIGSHLACRAYSPYAPIALLHDGFWFFEIFPRGSLGTIFSSFGLILSYLAQFAVINIVMIFVCTWIVMIVSSLWTGFAD